MMSRTGFISIKERGHCSRAFVAVLLNRESLPFAKVLLLEGVDSGSIACLAVGYQIANKEPLAEKLLSPPELYEALKYNTVFYLHQSQFRIFAEAVFIMEHSNR